MPTAKKALIETLAEQSFMLHVLNKRLWNLEFCIGISLSFRLKRRRTISKISRIRRLRVAFISIRCASVLDCEHGRDSEEETRVRHGHEAKLGSEEEYSKTETQGSE